MKTTEETIAALLAHIESECTAIDREARFDAMLDEFYSFDSVGGPFAHMRPSSVLKECDPTAYRCGVNDWADGEGWAEINDNYYDGDEAEKARESFVEELENEASDLETELEEEQESDDPNPSEIGRLSRELDELRANIAAAEKHAL